MTDLSAYDWLRLHTLRRWIAKMERDGPVPGIIKPALAQQRHQERVDFARSRADELQASLTEPRARRAICASSLSTCRQPSGWRSFEVAI